MWTTHWSWHLMKRNWILSTEEVCPNLWTNFDSKRNEGYKCFFSRNQCVKIMYPNETYQFVLTLHKKKLDSIHGRSSSHFKDKHWFQTKRRLQLLASRNQCINIVYPNENYPFFLALLEKKLDFISERCSSCFKDKFWFPTKRRVVMVFFYETNTSILCIPMRTTHLY